MLISYHCGDAGNALTSVSLGINDTRCTDAKTPFGWQISLSESWGLTSQVGLDSAVNKQWGLFASLGAAHQVKRNRVAVGAAALRSTIDFRPVTYSAGAYCKF